MTSLTMSGQLSVHQRLDVLRLTAQKRKRITGQIGRKFRVVSRKRLREQKNINGTSWTKRAGKSKRKMLRGLSKRMVVRADANKVDVGFNNASTGRIAKQQQEGMSETFTAAKAARAYGTPPADAPATRPQAKRLRALDYKIRRGNGKGWKKATLNWITSNLSSAQAGVIIRSMSNEPSKSQWAIHLPARSFLGATQHDINTMVQTVVDQTINATHSA